MTTRTAFADLISNKELCLAIGMKENYLKQMRFRFKDNKDLSEEKMKYWLGKAGYKHKPERWQKPKGVKTQDSSQ